ncbi:hypothetical protein HYV57_04525 [Candidatus Peregrinibacteria bacterium]|nr:hypothetical protein [Candidatus Peregrinibacteria bacterium]
MKKYFLFIPLLSLIVSVFFLKMFFQQPNVVTSAETQGTNSADEENNNTQINDADLETYIQNFSNFLKNESQCLDPADEDALIKDLDSLRTQGGTIPETNECRDFIQKCFDGQQKQFSDLISQHFQNNDSTENLLEPAAELIRSFEDESAKLKNFIMIKIQTGRDFSVADEFEKSCETVRTDLYDNILWPSLREFSLESAGAKRSEIFLQKYKGINTQLASLNELMAHWQGYTESLAQKIPALSKYCQ